MKARVLEDPTKVEVTAGDAKWTVDKRIADYHYLHKNLSRKLPKPTEDTLQQWIDALPDCPQVSAFFHVHKHVDSVAKMGYLSKLGGNKQGGAGNWKRRFVVLGDHLEYFENQDVYENGGAPKGTINLNCSYCPMSETSEFTVYALPYELACRADSIDDMRSWVAALQQHPIPFQV